MLYPYDAPTHSKHGDESPFQQFSLVTFQHRVDSAIRYLPAIAWIILREHFYPRGLSHQVKLNLSPLAAVVYLIGVDSGGDFLAFPLDGFLLEPHAMELTKFNQLKRQLFYRAFIRTFRTGCAAPAFPKNYPVSS